MVYCDQDNYSVWLSDWLRGWNELIEALNVIIMMITLMKSKLLLVPQLAASVRLVLVELHTGQPGL